jgi:predicted tellurium resistance membrane protein TerC
VERWGLLLFIAAIVAGFAIREKRRHRYFGLALAASAWTFLLFFLAASTY